MEMMSKYLDFRLRLLVLSFMIVKCEDLGYTITNTNINHTTKLYFWIFQSNATAIQCNIMHMCDLCAAGVADDETDRGDEIRQGQREPRDHRHRPRAAGARPGAVQQSGHRHNQHLEQRIGEVHPHIRLYQFRL